MMYQQLEVYEYGLGCHGVGMRIERSVGELGIRVAPAAPPAGGLWLLAPGKMGGRSKGGDG